MRTDTQRIDVAGFDAPVRADLAFRNAFYARHVFRLPHAHARGHIFRIPRSPRLAMRVSVDPGALAFDFSKSSARPGVPGKPYLGRPGIYLSNLVRDIADVQGFCLGLNGNNLGYWPNQFAVVGGALIFKSVPGLYENVPEDVSGPARFLAQTEDGRFEIQTIAAVSSVHDGHRSVTAADGIGFPSGISGYPLLLQSRPLWDESRRDAWDPKLVVEVPRAHEKTRTALAQIAADAILTPSEWPRHAFTLAGTTAGGELFLAAVEERAHHDGGIGPASAADLMRSLGCTDAIVLGGKGDVQAVSSDEGPIARPLLSPHDLEASRPAHTFGAHPEPERINHEGRILERPIPCALVLCAKSAR